MNTNRQLIEQFLQFINTGDATIGKPIISDDGYLLRSYFTRVSMAYLICSHS